MRISERARLLKPSATLAVAAKAKAMKAEGIDVVDLSVGEPDFDTPYHIKEAAQRAMEMGFTKYTPVGGMDELKDAIIERISIDHGIKYSRSEIIVSSGGKHVLYNCALALLEPGDEVIVPTPCWVSYPPIIELAGATPVFVRGEEEDDFKVRVDKIEKAITSRTKAIIINSPSNPTGSVYLPEELSSIARIAIERDIYVISDDIYIKFLYKDTPSCTIASLGDEIKERTIVVNGLSKTYAMTGWRIGYAAGSKDIISAMTNIQSQTTSCPNSIAQMAGIEALKGPQEPVKNMVEEFDRRRRAMIQGLRSIEGIRCFEPMGAFYAFPNVSSFYGRKHMGKSINDSISLSTYLLEEGRVAVVPGAEFYSDDHIRLSYATSMERIEEALKRIASALEAL
jgi:aspartate aminotransferase